MMTQATRTADSVCPGITPRGRFRRSLVFYRCDPKASASDHDLSTKAQVASSLADLLGFDFAGDYHDLKGAAAMNDAGAPYFVPSDTLFGIREANRLGIRTAGDLFGGVVPFPFAATKAITHPLVRADACAPAGWSAAFTDRVRDVVLPGYTTFTLSDAKLAGRRLLEDGTVRLKDAGGVGGAGQSVVSSPQELEKTLHSIDPDTLSRQGLVLERNLNKVATHSIGQVQVGNWTASYFGTQRMTRNHHGHDVYGGSTLIMTRCGFAELLGLDHPDDVRLAIEQALTYHRAALRCFSGMFASRCNYDVVQGVDDAGRWRSGVLEQSWRIGGASGAEIAGLHAFRADGDLRIVRAAGHEVYGDNVDVPPGAVIHFDGVDRRVGRLTKYVTVEPYDDT